jgi:hypothetical protein
VADSLARKYLNKSSKDFWKEIKTINNSSSKLGPEDVQSINGVLGASNICNMWQDHFKGLLTSCQDFSKKEQVLNAIEQVDFVERFNVPDVKEAIKNLKKDKSPGLDGITSEHFIYAHEKVTVLLCLLFNCVTVHAHLPSNLMDTLIIPIVKDNKGNIMDKDNYRPIALTCITSKILELVVLHKYQDKLITTDSQFGFKSNHSTDTCTFVLKEVIDFYVSQSSPMYLCFMDASKAFDRVNHWILFDKLIKRGMPLFIVRLLSAWYTTQEFIVKWSDLLSQSFTVTNGVRQGGILSPVLFNVFIDDLSVLLTESHHGCCINSVFVNHLFYADDSVLLAPSPYALQRLIGICEQFAKENDMLYNTKKTVCMFISTKKWRHLHPPSLSLYGKKLCWVTEVKYLGIFISDKQTDDRDIRRQLRGIYARGNMLVRKFGKCSADVKIQLFKSYCNNLYCCQLWKNYSKVNFNKIKVAYNNVYRMLMKIKSACSISQLYVYNNVDGFTVLVRKSIVNFRNRIFCSENSIICAIHTSSFFHYSSQLTEKWHSLIF